jgi:hypothetical protein
MRKWRRASGRLLTTRFLTASAVGLLPLGVAATAVADSAIPVTFAQFQEATTGSNANQFAYNNNGQGNATFGTQSGDVFGAPIPVTFSFLTVVGTLPADLQIPQDATLTLTSSTEHAVQPFLSGAIGDQEIDGTGITTDVLTITRDTPAAEGNGARTNLLTMTFSGSLLGTVDGRTPQLSGNTPMDLVSYSSDFLDFSTSKEENFSLTFTSWTSADGGGLELAPDGNYASAVAAGTGTFDDMPAPSVPEPASGLGLVGMFSMLGARRRRASR